MWRRNFLLAVSPMEIPGGGVELYMIKGEPWGTQNATSLEFHWREAGHGKILDHVLALRVPASVLHTPRARMITLFFLTIDPSSKPGNSWIAVANGQG